MAAKLRTRQWNPEQISRTFRQQGIGKISHESICQRDLDENTNGMSRQSFPQRL